MKLQELIDKAVEAGLVAPVTQVGEKFVFELNEGDLRLWNPTPERVLALVKLACDLEPDKKSGLHIALLQMCKEQYPLKGATRTRWCASYYYGVDTSMSLDKWLKQNGINVRHELGLKS